MGATALAVTDVALTTAARAAGVGLSSAAALVVLSASAGLEVTELGRRVGLSQPAATRVVDALAARGLVERRAGRGRGVDVLVTPAGRRAARELLAAREAPLVDVVGLLDDEDSEALAALLAKVLTRLYHRIGHAERMCRLCNRTACTTGAVCPVGDAERRHGP